MQTKQNQHESKKKLLDAALRVIRERGYEATRVEDICVAAGLTKGSFFHHFKSKEELALAAVEHWNAVTGAVFASAPYRSQPDPLERVLAYIDFRKGLFRGDLPQFTCLVGTMVQEVFATHPQLREACDQSINRHAATLEFDIELAMKRHKVQGNWTPRSLAFYTQATIQGAIILAKARGGPEVAETMMDHLRRYVELLFRRNENSDAGPEPRMNAVAARPIHG